MIILRQRSFSEEPKQKEFNSKAAKALNNKYLKEVATKKGISVDPNFSDWKHKVRESVRDDIAYPSGSREKFNKYLGDKAMGSASNLNLGRLSFNLLGRGNGKKEYKNALLNEYDHGINNRLIDDVRKRKTLVRGAKNKRLAKHKQ